MRQPSLRLAREYLLMTQTKLRIWKRWVIQINTEEQKLSDCDALTEQINPYR